MRYSRLFMAFPGSVLMIVSGYTLMRGALGAALFEQVLCIHLIGQAISIAAICLPSAAERERRERWKVAANTYLKNCFKIETGERVAQFHPGTQTVRLLYGSVFLGILLYLLIAGGVQAKNLYMLKTTGVTTTGTILGTDHREGKPQMTVTYSFIVPGAPPIADSFRTHPNRIGEMRTGNALTITYAPLQPEVHTWEVVDNGYLVRQILTGTCLFCIVMTYLLFPIVLVEGRWRRQLRLARFGVALTGTIEACRPLILGGKRLGYQVVYSFELPSDENPENNQYNNNSATSSVQKAFGRALVSHLAGEPTLPGFPITVLVDPKRLWVHQPLAALKAVYIANLRRGVLVGRS